MFRTLFQKKLQYSDVGILRRMVIPKVCTSLYFYVNCTYILEYVIKVWLNHFWSMRIFWLLTNFGIQEYFYIIVSSICIYMKLLWISYFYYDAQKDAEDHLPSLDIMRPSLVMQVEDMTLPYMWSLRYRYLLLSDNIHMLLFSHYIFLYIYMFLLGFFFILNGI